MQSLRRTLLPRLSHQNDLLNCAKQQAAAMSKVAKGGGGGGGGSSEGSGDSKLQLMMKALEAQRVKPTPLSPEQLAEAERRAKEYSRLKMREHRAWQADLTAKIKLKKAAIAALPAELQAAAMVPDYTPFPSNRQVWTETPPVEEQAAGPAVEQRGPKRRIGTKHR